MEPGLARVFIFPFIKKQLIIPVKELLMSLFTLAEKWLQDTPQRTYSECIHKPARALGTTNNLWRGSAFGFLPFHLFVSLFVFLPPPVQFNRSGRKPADLEHAGWDVHSWTATGLAQGAQCQRETACWAADGERGKRMCSVFNPPTKPRSATEIIRRWRCTRLPLHPVLWPLIHGMGWLPSTAPGWSALISAYEKATQVMS